MMDRDWCRDETMASLLDIPVSTFREYVEKGWLPKGVKIGKHRLWSRASVNAALARMQEPSFDDGGIRAAIEGMGHGKKKETPRNAA
jgi:predicted DNA-binding transcriptional regulator AlpA